jgi:hypothetical protein
MNPRKYKKKSKKKTLAGNKGISVKNTEPTSLLQHVLSLA